jgi:hypothetical protein
MNYDDNPKYARADAWTKITEEEQNDEEYEH